MSAASGVSCLFCSCERLGSPDEPPAVDSPIFCGGCGALMVLDARQVDGEWEPFLRRVRAVEREQLLRRDDVRRYRDAYALDQVEAALPRQNDKPEKLKTIGPGPVRLKSGERIRLEGKGPDAR